MQEAISIPTYLHNYILYCNSLKGLFGYKTNKQNKKGGNVSYVLKKMMTKS